MRKAVAIGVATLAIAAACSTFDSTDTPATSSPDAGTDGSEAGASTSCSGADHFLCDDFASETFPAPVWNGGKDEGAPGAFALSTEQSTSPPRSLLVTVEGDSGSTAG